MVLLSGIPGAETEQGRRDAATGFTYLFRFVHSIALRKRQCLRESQGGMFPHNIRNDLADKAAVIITAAFQTGSGGRSSMLHPFLGPGLALRTCCSGDPRRKTCASVATEEQFPAHPPANCWSKARVACPGGQVMNGTKRTASAAGLPVTSPIQLQALDLSLPFC